MVGQQRSTGDSAEWASLEAYMGLFEHCEALLDDGLVDEKTFARIYSYRLKNIVANPVIVEEKLRKRKAGWLSFSGTSRSNEDRSSRMKCLRPRQTSEHTKSQVVSGSWLILT